MWEQIVDFIMNPGVLVGAIAFCVFGLLFVASVLLGGSMTCPVCGKIMTRFPLPYEFSEEIYRCFNCEFGRSSDERLD